MAIEIVFNKHARLLDLFTRQRWFWITAIAWGEEFYLHPAQCLVAAWQTRFGKNAMLSIGAWVFLYGVFYLEVAHLGLSSRQAKLMWSPMGIPSGLMIQWFVFGDRVITLQQNMNWRHLAARLSWRLLAAKSVFFFANQAAFIVALLILPYLIAAPVAAVAMSMIYYVVSLVWITAPAKGVREVGAA